MPRADAAPTVAGIGEAELLRRLQRWLAVDGGDMVVGAGDDAAVWQPPLGHAVVATTDSLVAGAHFREPLTPVTATDLGWRLLAVSLSDLAAMGAVAGPAFIALALPGTWQLTWVDALYQGLAECAAQAGARLAGGNISAATTAVLTSTCLGSVDRQGVLRRRGARAGWELAVSGPLGGAAALLRAPAETATWPSAARPVPRLEAGQLLASVGVRVAMDVSDGLFVDASRLLEGAACSGLVIDPASLPVAAEVRDRWPREWLEIAAGGEDYELLFAAPPAAMRRAIAALAASGLAPVVIGRFDEGVGLRLGSDGQEVAPPAAGHEHFRS